MMLVLDTLAVYLIMVSYRPNTDCPKHHFQAGFVRKLVCYMQVVLLLLTFADIVAQLLATPAAAGSVGSAAAA
jgi:hypothetical protein